MQPLNTSLSVVIADDHPFFRDGLKFMLQKAKDKNITLKGEAGDGDELFDIVMDVKPDIVITDIMMPRLDGIKATRKIKEQLPSTQVIAVSMLDETGMVVDMFEAGATGYLVKNAPKEEILQAIEVVRYNGVYFSNSTSKKFLAAIVNTRHNPHFKSPVIKFNQQERTIILLICRQLTTKEIAAQMKLSTRTVEDNRYRIQEKIGAKCAVGIALYAIKHGVARWEDL